VEAILDTIQEFDPAGVAATTMAECLLLQAKRIEDRDVLVDTIITSHLDKLFSKDLKAIARAESMDIECVVSASKVITESLTPTPGSGFGSDSADVVVPDVSIKKVGDEYVVMLNDDGMPRLRISTYYKAMLEGRSAGADAAGYVRDKLRSALWLIKSVHQRQRTIKRTVECIARFQVEFLDRGVKYLKPMVLKDVAEEIGMHESTISRVTTNKYVDTPRGIFELKYFFNTAIGESENGSELTSRYIKEKIKAIIDGENARSPLSDQRICEMLKEASIDIARRTVAKYREELGLFPSSKRRVRY
ncbi:MAG: RNA polymerase factor sigma-54, partial [Deltaproteobacteria bacterium]|nr:RNA polymerase factor sigma-54 [Deltaproteobacteria bacterium]